MDLEALLAQLENLADLDAEQLAQLRSDLIAAADERTGDNLTDDTLAELRQISEAMQAVTTEVAAREEADANRQAEADELLRQIRGEDGDDDDNSDDSDDDDSDDDAEATDAATTPAADDAPADDREPEPVTAAAPAPAPAPATPRATRVAARRPRSMEPRQSASTGQLSLVASANLPGINAGSTLIGPEQIAEAFMQVLRASVGYRGPRMQMPVGRLGAFDAESVYGPERTLGQDTRLNRQRIDAVTSPQAIVASGGVCAPTPVRYDFPVVGTDSRPVRDQAMARFGADRGGVRLLPPVTLDDVTSGVDVWTEANDQSPADPATKPCVTVTCPDPTEYLVDAITRCIEAGNFRARFFPEQIEEWLRMAGVQHARLAETTLLTAIGAGSTNVNVGTVLGTARDVLTNLDRAHAGFVSRHRAESNTRLRFVAPFWLRNNMRTDLARELPGSTDERLAVADAQIDSFFAARYINPTWVLDGESGQVFGSQPASTLLGWPSTVVTYLYPEGSWLFLDGGELNLGIVRDSTLNGTNDFQMFMETFEKAAFHGVESLRMNMDICPDGSTSAAVDINPCATGS